jgi:AraC-like DNA-binding protein
VKELLFLLLGISFNPDKIQQRFTPFEVARVHQVKDILESYLAKKPPTLKELSNQSGLNQFKLKLGFRKYFNMNVFDWLQYRKMEKAKELLLHTNRPIKEIGALVGYPLTTNFTTAFRKHFGITPGQIRRS